MTEDGPLVYSMAMKREHEELKSIIASLFGEAAGGRISAYLYGSRATGYERADSDYDFAFIAPAPIDKAELGRMRDAIAARLPGEADVDCVDMRSIPLTLVAQVLESGIVLLSGDDFERAMLETRLMSMYANLNEERREILEDIAERGSVYAR